MPKRIQNTTALIASKDINKVSASSKNIVKADKTIALQKPQEKWAKSKFTLGDYFSCHQYMQVKEIVGTSIKLIN